MKDIQPLHTQKAITFTSGENIKLAFTKLTTFVTDTIKHINFSTLKRAVIEQATSPDMLYKSNDILPIVKATQSFENLCESLACTTFWSFLDIRILEAMATASFIPVAQESIKNFKRAYFGMTLKEAAPHFPVVPAKSGHTIMEETLDKDPSQMTIGELHQHRFFLETELLEVGSNKFTICKIVVGSVQIVWQIHVDDVYQAHVALEKNLSQFAVESISHLSIPGVIRWEKLPILWRGQEVKHIGPLENVIGDNPCSLPEGLEWTSLDFGNLNEITQLHDITCTNKYKNSISWNFKHPKYQSSLVFGVRESDNKKLVQAIWCIPCHISVNRQLLPVVELQQKWAQYEQDDLYNVIIREAMRRIEMSQLLLALPTPEIIRPVVTFTLWVYNFLDPLYDIPYNTPKTVGLRRMKQTDVQCVFSLTNQYVSKFEIGQVFQSEEELSHYLLSSSQYSMSAWVVEDPTDGTISDVFGFWMYVDGVVRSATVSAIINTKSTTRQLITDLLLCARLEQVDALATQQFGLTRSNFENLLVHEYQYGYWHICNYSYPEVDEEKCCVFSFNITATAITAKMNSIALHKLSTSEDFEQLVVITQVMKKLVLKSWRQQSKTTIETLETEKQSVNDSISASSDFSTSIQLLLATIIIIQIMAIVGGMVATMAGSTSVLFSGIIVGIVRGFKVYRATRALLSRPLLNIITAATVIAGTIAGLRAEFVLLEIVPKATPNILFYILAVMALVIFIVRILQGAIAVQNTLVGIIITAILGEQQAPRKPSEVIKETIVVLGFVGSTVGATAVNLMTLVELAEIEVLRSFMMITVTIAFWGFPILLLILTWPPQFPYFIKKVRESVAVVSVLLFIVMITYFLDAVIFTPGIKIFMTILVAIFATTVIAYVAETLAAITVLLLLNYGTLIKLDEQLAQLKLQTGTVIKSIEDYRKVLSELSQLTGSVATEIRRIAAKYPPVATDDVWNYLSSVVIGNAECMVSISVCK